MLMMLDQLTGMPVVWQGKLVGMVEHGVTDAQASQLMGLIIRHGLHAAKWVPSHGISLIGRHCIAIAIPPGKIPLQLPQRVSRMYRDDGSLLGVVTDAVICMETCRIKALEISESLAGRILGQHRYAVEYHIGVGVPGGNRFVTNTLLTLAELSSRLEGHG